MLSLHLIEWWKTKNRFRRTSLRSFLSDLNSRVHNITEGKNVQKIYGGGVEGLVEPTVV